MIRAAATHSLRAQRRGGWAEPLAPALWGRAGTDLPPHGDLALQQRRASSSAASTSADPAPRAPAKGAKDPAVDPALGFIKGGYDVGMFPPHRIRNFCVVAHVVNWAGG